MVEAAGRRIGRGDLAERGGDDQREDAADDPADGRPRSRRPVAMASGNEVMPPARMQMIEKEMAKFEKPLMRRASSWA